MPIPTETGYTVLGAVFAKEQWPSRGFVDGFLYEMGYNADDFLIEESEKNYRTLFPKLKLGVFDSATQKRVEDPNWSGVSYVVAKESEAFRFSAGGAVHASPVLFDVGEGAKAGADVYTFTGLKVGKFKHTGREFEITSNDLETMVRNFNSRVLKKDLPIDYSHNDHERAAGWITGLSLNETKTALIVSAKFTPAGAEALASREFRYFSADFYLAYSDPEDGREFGMVLRGGALTNIPFIKEAEIVPMSEDRLADFLTKTEGTKIMSENIAELRADLKLAQAKLSESEKDNEKLSEIVKGVDGLKAEIKKLSDEKKELEVKLSTIEKDQAFDKLLADGRACEAQREAFRAGDTAKFAELYKPVNVKKNADPKAEGGDETVELSEKEKEFCKRRGISEQEYIAAASADAKRGRSVMAAVVKEGK